MEAGAKFINVYFARYIGGADGGWDYHGFKGESVVDRLSRLPVTDHRPRRFRRLITDLEERGLLDTTLVVWVGEFGRTPKISSNGGRDHWPQCYNAVLAGGGARKGYVHGASDKLAAQPTVGRVTPEDLAATMFDALGLGPAKWKFAIRRIGRCRSVVASRSTNCSVKSRPVAGRGWRPFPEWRSWAESRRREQPPFGVEHRSAFRWRWPIYRLRFGLLRFRGHGGFHFRGCFRLHGRHGFFRRLDRANHAENHERDHDHADYTGAPDDNRPRIRPRLASFLLPLGSDRRPSLQSHPRPPFPPVRG